MGLLEELGFINFILSDKTGTMTKNVLEFKEMAVNDKIINIDNIKEMKS